jgi:hypothetical protein
MMIAAWAAIVAGVELAMGVPLDRALRVRQDQTGRYGPAELRSCLVWTDV